MNAAHLQILHHALNRLGSKECLCKALWIPAAELDSYLRGEKPVPFEIYWTAIDVVTRDP